MRRNPTRPLAQDSSNIEIGTDLIGDVASTEVAMVSIARFAKEAHAKAFGFCNISHYG
jgi:hypothetical protein